MTQVRFAQPNPVERDMHWRYTVRADFHGRGQPDIWRERCTSEHPVGSSAGLTGYLESLSSDGCSQPFPCYAVGYGFREMDAPNTVAVVQIRKCSGYFQHPMIGTRREFHLVSRIP